MHMSRTYHTHDTHMHLAHGPYAQVRDGLRMRDVLAELHAAGVDGAMPLAALGTAASRFHGAAAGEAAASSGGDVNAGDAGGGDEASGGADGGADGGTDGGTDGVPEWATEAAERAPPPPPTEGAAQRTAADRAPSTGEAAAAAGAALTEAEQAALEDAEAHEAAVQSAGTHALRTGSVRWRVVVAKESAVRGLDLPHLDLVLLTSMPSSVESYVHIAGRTGRAGGAAGRAVSILTRRELRQAGSLTRALQGVRWKVRDYAPPPQDVAAEAAAD